MFKVTQELQHNYVVTHIYLVVYIKYRFYYDVF